MKTKKGTLGFQNKNLIYFINQYQFVGPDN